MEPVQVELHGGLSLFSIPPPGSGVLTAYILNIIDGHLQKRSNTNVPMSRDPVVYQRITEAFKHAYAWRTKLADPKYTPEVLEVSVCTQCFF